MASAAACRPLLEAAAAAADFWATSRDVWLATWDAWVTWWERQPWTSEWAAEGPTLGRLSQARWHLEQQASARHMASGYFARAAARASGDRRTLLDEAARGYDQTATALGKAGEMLPEDNGGDELSDGDAARVAEIHQCSPLMRRAREGDRRALQALAQLLDRGQIPSVTEDPLRHRGAGMRLFAWRADQNHGLYELVLVGDALQQRWLSGRDADGVSWEVFEAPVQRPGWVVAVEALKGEGVYEVLQQPAPDNGWTAIVRVDDRLDDFHMWWGKDSFETDLVVWAVPQSAAGQ